MLTLAALTLSLASTLAPNSDPGAAPIGAAAFETVRASGEAASGPAPRAAGSTDGTDATLSPTGGAASSAAAIIGTANIGTANIGTATSLTDGSASSRGGFPVGSMIPVLGLALCGAAAIVFAKKKQTAPKLLQIVETHSLGGRRSLIVARIAGETVLLGASESGLSLLLARPGETVADLAAAQSVQAAQTALRALDSPVQAAAAKISGVLNSSWLGRLRLARSQDEAAAENPSFEEILERDAQARTQGRARTAPAASNVEPALLRQPLDPLAESAEDQELRRKLAAGRAGRIA